MSTVGGVSGHKIATRSLFRRTHASDKTKECELTALAEEFKITPEISPTPSRAQSETVRRSPRPIPNSDPSRSVKRSVLLFPDLSRHGPRPSTRENLCALTSVG